MGEVQRRVGVASEHGGGRHELELKHFKVLAIFKR